MYITKRVKRISIAVIATTVLVVGGVWIWQSVKLTKQEKALKDTFEATKKSEVPPSKIDPSKALLITKYINEGKYSEARSLVDELLKQSNLLERDKRALLASQQVVCTKQEDLGCLQNVINEQKNSNTVNVFLVIDTAAIAERKQNKTVSKQMYQLAKSTIDSKGGKAYVDSLNQNTDSPINYEVIVGKAQ